MKQETNQTEMQGNELNPLLGAVCPDCGGDGRETCHNPDHGFIIGIGTVMLNGHANGCPCCGNDPDHKVKKGGQCETCAGVGRVTIETAEQFIDMMDYDMEVQLVGANCT